MRRRFITAARHPVTISVSLFVMTACSSAVSGHGAARPQSSSVARSDTATATGRAAGSSTDGSFEARGVIAPAVRVSGAASVPLDSLGFDLPSSADEYDALTAAQKAALSGALAGADCAHPPAGATSTRVVCESVEGQQPVALLTGPVIVDARQVRSARALPPDMAANRLQWTVQLILTASGADAWAAYTAAHNTGAQSAAGDVTACSPAGTPCADYVAMIADGAAVSVPLTVTAIRGAATEISGSFDRAGAMKLAATIHR